MKDLKTFINNEISIISEGLKDIDLPRKGSYIYILKDGETKVQKVKIVNVIKERMGDGYDGSYIYTAELEDNAFNIKTYRSWRFKSIDYNTPKLVDTKMYDKTTYYFGVDAKSISEFVKSSSSNKLKSLLQEITRLENELAEANANKVKLEIMINGEISESLDESKQSYVEFKLFDDDASKHAIGKIREICQKNSIYYENINDGIRLKITPGAKLENIEDILLNVVNNIPDDKKEELQDASDDIIKNIELMKSAAEVESGE